MKLNTAREVIDHYGGNRKFADALNAGVSPQVVNNWYRDNKFPANAYVLITMLLDSAGIITLDSAYSMRTRKKRR